MENYGYVHIYTLDAFDYLSLVLSVVVIFLHTYGVQILKSLKDINGKTHVYIANYSIWNVFWACSNLARYPVMKYANEITFQFWTLTIEGARIPFYLGIFYITMDRFLQLHHHMRYINCFFYKYKLNLCLLACILYILWLSVTLPLFACKYVSFEVLIQCTSIYISGGFHALIVILFTTVYSYIGRKLYKNCSHHRFEHVLRKIATPFIIVIVFVLFETIPDLFMFCGIAQYGSWTIFLFRMDGLCNALIYIFLQPKVKAKVLNTAIINRLTKSKSQEDSPRTTGMQL